ncbi:MAG: hypothetical protein AAGK66_00740 [Pseudomonadota bacterium]
MEFELVIKGGLRLGTLGAVSAALLGGSAWMAFADTPEAGTNIVNQATVLYTDSEGTDRETTTNEVILFVQAVYSSTLEADQSRNVAAGGDARFIHTLTNTGNSSNTFCISASDLGSDSGDFDRIDVILDANGDGEANSDEQIVFSSSASAAGELVVNSGQAVGLIAVGRIPAGASAGQTYALDLSVSSQDGTGTCGTGLPEDLGADADSTDGTNRDIATVTSDAVLEVTKASEYNPGLANDLSDDQIDYIIRVRNTGVIDATDVLITDVLPTSVTFDSFITTTNGETHLSGEVTATATTLAVNDEIEIRFTVNVDPTLGFTGDPLIIENTASAEADTDGVSGREAAIESNTVRDEIDPVYGVTLSDIGGTASPGANDGADDDGTVNDLQLVDTAAPGDTVRFTLTVTNNGNTTDTFNLTETSRAGWFNGAGLRYLNADFATPLLDTTGDGISDTGPLAPGESLTFMVEAVLPFTEPPSPHTLGLLATSTADLSGGAVNVSDPTTLAIGSGLTPGVDIANSAGAMGLNDGGSVNADPDTAVTTTLSGAPGNTVVFDLFIANEGSGPDNFALAAFANAAATTDLPDGWSVDFVALDGTRITATGRLDAGNLFAYQARVIIDPDAADGATQSVFFQASSFDTGVSDIKQDAVSVSATPAITLTPDQFGQIAACGRKEHLHTLRNSGGTGESVTLTVISQSALASEIRFPTSVLSGGPATYQDVALLAPGDPIAVLSGGSWATVSLITDGSGGVAIPLGPNDETRIMARILASCDIAPGTVDVLILEAETLDGDANARVTDTTTVASARLDIIKLGALDTSCLGGADTAFDDARVQAEPGDCVIWQITLKNAGVEPVCDVTARDAAPAFTSIFGSVLITQQPNPGTGLCNVNGNEFACTLGNSIDIDGDSSNENHCLRGGEEAQVQFSVSIE